MTLTSFLFEDPDEESLRIPILCDFLQPDTKLSMESAVQAILDRFPVPLDSPNNDQVSVFCGEAVSLTEQIPYDHPSMIKLVNLLGYVHNAPGFMKDEPKTSKAGEPSVCIHEQRTKYLEWN